MCGICGFIPQDAATVPEAYVLEKMCKSLRHRGPDAMGLYQGAGIGLGHQRLKIIDLHAGQQPMSDATGRYTLVFNGEVYNYRQLRDELLRKGYVFTSQSDTEVLLYGLIAHGIAFLEKVNGMFAFAFYDAHEKSLLLARDRFGVKPLYYADIANVGTYFASEATAIASACPKLTSINDESATLFLAMSYIPGEYSIFKAIKRLNPGAYIKIEQGHIITQGLWWNILHEWEADQDNTCTYSCTDWHEHFRETLEDCVKIRLKADVPLGVFLSGGIDSATVAALATQHFSGILSFTMAFHDKSYNEAPYALETAQFLNTKHHEAIADLGSQEELEHLVNTLDEPFADTSVIPMHTLCKLAKQHVTVALTGDGADELLGGYITHRANQLYKKLHYVPAFIVKALRTFTNLLPDSHKKVNTIFKLKQFLAAYPRQEELAHACWRLIFYPEALQKLLPNLEYIPNIFSFFQEAWDESRGLAHFDRFLYVDYKTWLTHDILFKADRASMHNSLELRSPFLDYRLFKLCAHMPTMYKRSGTRGKIILRNIAADLLPASCMKRPKTGFNAPVATWLTQEWRALSEECFSTQSLNDVGLEPVYVQNLWKQHKKGWYSHGYQLFNILVYVLWRKKHSQGRLAD